jgi:hypothetical protein
MCFASSVTRRFSNGRIPGDTIDARMNSGTISRRSSGGAREIDRGDGREGDRIRRIAFLADAISLAWIGAADGAARSGDSASARVLAAASLTEVVEASRNGSKGPVSSRASAFERACAPDRRRRAGRRLPLREPGVGRLPVGGERRRRCTRGVRAQPARLHRREGKSARRTRSERPQDAARPPRPGRPGRDRRCGRSGG